MLFVALSCGNDGFDSTELDQYVDRFEAEANERGQTYINEIANIEIHLVEIITPGILGQCVRGLSDPNQIHIDRAYWLEADDLQKEFVVFHELGHCILNKDHENTAGANGNCISIMYDGNSNECLLSYNLDTKEAMLDELFQ